LIGVNVVGHEPKKLKEVMSKENVNWRSLASRDVSAKWNAATPTYYVIDHHGVIRNKWVGSRGERAIDTVLEKLIKEVEEDEKKLMK
jgi:peroxiredoxin